MSSRARIEVAGLDAWIDGLDRFGLPTEAMLDRWRQATDVFFDRTQSAAHIVTGSLKDSGRMQAFRDRRELVGEVVYGGTQECDYAVYEFARGGAHDALTVGFAETQAVFEKTLARMLVEEVASWK
jgi:hypothetical protein